MTRDAAQDRAAQGTEAQGAAAQGTDTQDTAAQGAVAQDTVAQGAAARGADKQRTSAPGTATQQATAATPPPGEPLIGLVMGSSSDWDVMQHAAAVLTEFDIPFEARVVSAHRMPDEMFAYAQAARGRGLAAIIAGAGGAAHLPGMLAAKTPVPVLGVPVPGKYLRGVDSLHSIVQMPRGVPVATFAIGEAGAANAALFAVAMLAGVLPRLAGELDAFRQRQNDAARAMILPPSVQGG